MVDPAFTVTVDGERVTLTDISRYIESQELEVAGMGTFRIHLIDGGDSDRTMRLHGVAWWVNKRLVGDWTWDGVIGSGRYLDGRSAEAKRYTFIVEADSLADDVRPDWTGFWDTSAVTTVRAHIHEHIWGRLQVLLKETRIERRKTALSRVSPKLSRIPRLSREHVISAVDAMLERSPYMQERDLTNMAEVLANLEQARTGYTLLEQLASVGPDELDKLVEILGKWTITDAKRVLDELYKRLDVISQMKTLVHNPQADELHQLQPLFGRGLWIFGPEYETVHFTSNQTVTSVIRQFFRVKALPVSSRRPDFVVLPDSSIGAYSRPRYDASGEESGPEKVVIIELKRGGFELTKQEMDQAVEYALSLQESGTLPADTTIEAFVLGASLGRGAAGGPVGWGNHIQAKPMAYSWVLERAHSRTFRLLHDLKDFVPSENLAEDIQSSLDLGGDAATGSH